MRRIIFVQWSRLVKKATLLSFSQFLAKMRPIGSIAAWEGNRGSIAPNSEFGMSSC